jgi:hypothetical protein
MKYLFFAVLLFLFGSSCSNPKIKKEQVYCMSLEGLNEVKSAVERNDPLIQTSFKKLCSQADKALLAGPFSVMYKIKIPPGGDKHDYMSVPPYAGTGDGLTNPEWYKDYDRVPLEQLTQSVETLALTYYFTEKQEYANRAALLLRTWFINSDTRMNPDLEFAQKNTHVGIIDTRFLSRIIDCVGIIQNSGAWTNNDQQSMVEWCNQFSKNIQKRIDKGHSDSGHNIASWYHVEMTSLALFTGNKELAQTMIKRTKARIDTAINSEGGFKRELGRTRSMSYSCFHSFALFNLVSMGEQIGMDLWNYKTNDGRGFELALEYLAKYLGNTNKKQWPYKEIEGANGDWWNPCNDMLPSVLYHAAKVYKNEKFNTVAEQILGNKLDESRIQIMCGIPIRWFDTVTHD